MAQPPKKTKADLMFGLETAGFGELNRLMDLMPQGPSKAAGKKALNKAANPIVKAAKDNGRRINHERIGLKRISGSNFLVRETTRNGHRIVTIYRPLGETVRKKAGVSRKTGQPYVVVGPESGTAPHASLIEFGTQGGYTVTRPGGATYTHPGIQPQPFLEDAFHRTRTRAQAIFNRAFVDDFGKEMLKVARRVGAI